MLQWKCAHHGCPPQVSQAALMHQCTLQTQLTVSVTNADIPLFPACLTSRPLSLITCCLGHS